MIIKSIHSKYEKFLKHIANNFITSNETIHKARNEIKIIPFNDEEFVVKSFRKPKFLFRIIYTYFRPSKAQKSYDNSLAIIDFVPHPIGYVEYTSFGLLTSSYFISKRFDYDFTIREPLLDSKFEDKTIIFKAFAKFTYELHQKGILHLDYSPGNILIKKENNKYTFKIVDINRMQFKSLSLNQRLKNFNKLWAKNEDMKIIATAYAKLINQNENECVSKAIYYSQKNKDVKNFKKKLKGKPVVD